MQNMKLLQLLNKIDSFELKATVPSKDHGSASLALNQAGVVVRARRIKGGIADTAVKLRPVHPEQLPEKFRRSGAMKVEVDSM